MGFPRVHRYHLELNLVAGDGDIAKEFVLQEFVPKLVISTNTVYGTSG